MLAVASHGAGAHAGDRQPPSLRRPTLMRCRYGSGAVPGFGEDQRALLVMAQIADASTQLVNPPSPPPGGWRYEVRWTRPQSAHHRARRADFAETQGTAPDPYLQRIKVGRRKTAAWRSPACAPAPWDATASMSRRPGRRAPGGNWHGWDRCAADDLIPAGDLGDPLLPYDLAGWPPRCTPTTRRRPRIFRLRCISACITC